MINTYNESSLHKTLKIMYSQDEGDRTEVEADGHIYDILKKDSSVIEIQTQNLSKLTPKILDALNKGRKVKIVYPLAESKKIETYDENNKKLSSRKSPKKLSIYSIFRELTGLYPALLISGFELEVVTVKITEIRKQSDIPVQTMNKKRRYKKNWLKTDKCLNEIIKTELFKTKDDWLKLFPEDLNEEFTVKDLQNSLAKNINRQASYYASLMIWVTFRMNLIIQTGNKGKARIYKINQKPQLEEYGSFVSVK